MQIEKRGWETIIWDDGARWQTSMPQWKTPASSFFASCAWRVGEDDGFALGKRVQSPNLEWEANPKLCTANWIFSTTSPTASLIVLSLSSPRLPISRFSSSHAQPKGDRNQAFNLQINAAHFILQAYAIAMTVSMTKSNCSFSWNESLSLLRDGMRVARLEKDTPRRTSIKKLTLFD